MPLCCFPKFFLSSHSTLVQREGWRSLWSLVRCTRARFCLLGSFMDWGSRSCSLAATSCYLFCPGWFSLLICTLGEVMGPESLRGFSLSSVAFSASSLHALRGGEAGSLPSSNPVRIPPWLPDLRLGKSGMCFEPARGRMALVIGLVAHTVAPLSMLG